MTFQEYINNPLGKANAVISNRVMYENLYTDKLNKIMVRENGKVDYKLYSSKKNYWIHIKAPSEVIEDFYYDVVVKIDNNGEKNLSNANVQFYSNDPHFVFTFVHAFHKNKMFIEELSDKMSKRALKEKAVEKNPTEQIGYVKSLYFAFLLIKERGLFHTLKFEAEAKPFNIKYIESEIMNADEKIDLRQKAQEKLNDTKRKEKKKEVSDNNSNRRKEIINPGVRDAEVPYSQNSRIKTTSVIGSSRNSKSSSNIKKIGTVRKK